MFTEKDKQHLRASWGKVAPVADTATELFYARLFHLRPDLRAYFPIDLTQQRGKLTQALGFVVDHLDDLTAVVPVLISMGKRHAGYRVVPEYYPVVGEALLWTLQKGPGKAFTPSVRKSWARAYGFVSRAMLEGASA